jgi:hypothetical protein
MGQPHVRGEWSSHTARRAPFRCGRFLVARVGHQARRKAASRGKLPPESKQPERLKRFANQALLPHLVVPADAILAALGSEQIDHPARRLSDLGPISRELRQGRELELLSLQLA